METEILQILAALGPSGIVAISMFYVVRIAKQMLPSENLQSQTLGMVQSQIDISRDQVAAIQQQNSISAALKEQIAAHDKNSNDRDDTLGKILERLITGQGTIQTGISTVVGAVDTLAKSWGEAHKKLDGINNTMVNTDVVNALSGKLDRIITMLEELKTMHESFGERLETVEKEVPPLKAQIHSLAHTSETSNPDESPEIPPNANDTTATVSPAPISKSQARAGADNGTGKTNDNDEQASADPVPTGG